MSKDHFNLSEQAYQAEIEKYKGKILQFRDILADIAAQAIIAGGRPGVKVEDFSDLTARGISTEGLELEAEILIVQKTQAKYLCVVSTGQWANGSYLSEENSLDIPDSVLVEYARLANPHCQKLEEREEKEIDSMWDDRFFTFGPKSPEYRRHIVRQDAVWDKYKNLFLRYVRNNRLSVMKSLAEDMEKVVKKFL